ncbi:MAG TPA: hypothetical protein VKT77_11690 [Chthonomonadaceae bacterium]|nr:hypothetical protein [Chthonomonadaceae bacterium]
MAIQLALSEELESHLREAADALGLSIEGYVVTLIETAVEPPAPAAKRGIGRILPALGRKAESAEGPTDAVRARMRQLNAELMERKERAIAAVARANALHRTVEQLQAAIAERELQSLRAERDGNSHEALLRFQESCVFGVSLQEARSRWSAAAAEAEPLVAAFQQLEQQAASRRKQLAGQGDRELPNTDISPFLTSDQLSTRIFAMADSETWQSRFDAWIRRATAPAPDISSCDSASLELELDR